MEVEVGRSRIIMETDEKKSLYLFRNFFFFIFPFPT
jgi:hypothetical protein